MFDLESHLKQLCEEYGYGYGYVMQLIAEMWKEKDPSGALTVGAPRNVGYTEDNHD